MKEKDGSSQSTNSKYLQSTRMRIYAIPIQLEILRILFAAGTRLRPSQIKQNLLEKGYNDLLQTPNLLHYHLMKLRLLKLIENDKINRALSYYEITENGKNLLFSAKSEENFLQEMATILAIRLKKPKEKIYEVLTSAFLKSD